MVEASSKMLIDKKVRVLIAQKQMLECCKNPEVKKFNKSFTTEQVCTFSLKNILL